MSERERWVVYPLLFLALGAALRDKLVDRTITKSIVCQELQVVDEEPIGGDGPRVLARIGRQAGSQPVGLLEVNGNARVTGAVNASQYASQGIPLMFFLQVPPGAKVPPTPLPRTRQQPNAPGGKQPGNSPPANPQSKKSASDAAPAPSKSDSDGSTSPPK